jgi:hypothetical protein
MHLHWLAIARR